MLANVFTKTIKDRQSGTLIGSLLVVAVAVLGLAAYSDLDDLLADMIAGMPEAWLSVMGLSGATDAGSLVLGQMYNLVAPLVLGGLAISMGSAAIAGEERNGTLGLLLGNPRSRQQVLAAKAGALVVLMGAGSLLIWGGGYLAAILFNTNIANSDLGAASLHVFAISLFFGFLALLIGSWTGNGGAASGGAASLLVISFVAAGLLPLIESWEDLARIFPWYYFDSSQPLVNGIDWGHLGVLSGLAALFAASSVVGVNRRDLRSGGIGRTLVDRLRDHRLTKKAMDRVAGSARVSRIAVKAISDHQGLATVAAAVIFFIAISVGPFFNGLSDVLADLTAAYPDALLAMIGFADLSTPEGWYQSEVFSLVAPAAFISVTTLMGARALAGEEETKTMDLLLANPITRSRVLVEKTLAMMAISFVLAVATFLGTAGGSLIAGLGMDLGNVASAALHVTLLGIFFGCVAVAFSAATGRRRVAAYGTAALAVISYFANAFLPVNENLAGWARLSPFHYYLGSDPLVNGVSWAHLGILAGLSLVTVALARVFFERRDLRG